MIDATTIQELKRKTEAAAECLAQFAKAPTQLAPVIEFNAYATPQLVSRLIGDLEREQGWGRFAVQLANQNHERWMACLSVLTEVTSERDRLLAENRALKAQVSG